MSIINRFRRRPRVLAIAAPSPLHPEEEHPLMSAVAQACAWDLPGFTVVREDAEMAWVDATVEAHRAALDAWTPDVFDHELSQRHRIRLSQIDAQAEVRRQDASRATAETEAALTSVAVLVADLRRREHDLWTEFEAWTRVLTGQQAVVGPEFASEPVPRPVAAPVRPAVLAAVEQHVWTVTPRMTPKASDEQAA